MDVDERGLVRAGADWRHVDPGGDHDTDGDDELLVCEVGGSCRYGDIRIEEVCQLSPRYVRQMGAGASDFRHPLRLCGLLPG